MAWKTSRGVFKNNHDLSRLRRSLAVSASVAKLAKSRMLLIISQLFVACHYQPSGRHMWPAQANTLGEVSLSPRLRFSPHAVGDLSVHAPYLVGGALPLRMMEC